MKNIAKKGLIGILLTLSLTACVTPMKQLNPRPPQHGKIQPPKGCDYSQTGPC